MNTSLHLIVIELYERVRERLLLSIFVDEKAEGHGHQVLELRQEFIGCGGGGKQGDSLHCEPIISLTSKECLIRLDNGCEVGRGGNDFHIPFILL